MRGAAVSLRADDRSDLTARPDVRDAIDQLTSALDESAPLVADLDAAVAGRDADLGRLTAEVEAVVRHLDTPVLVVDEALNVRLASPATEHLVEGDVRPGQPLAEVLPTPLV